MTTDTTLHCRTVAQSLDVDPIGTAGSYDAFVFIEAPLPWPRDIGGLPQLGDLERQLRTVRGRTGLAVRLQALVPEDRDDPTRRVIVHRVHEDRPGVFERFEIRVEEDGLADAAMRLVLDALAAPAGSGRSTRRRCSSGTHGGRDVCCGRDGAALWRQMRTAMPEVEFLRTSHTGGHRFAPTALTFPYGQLWAWLDRPILADIIQQSGRDPAELVHRHYRGSAALPSSAVQILEREAFAREGWAWLANRRRGYQVTTSDTGIVTARIDFELAGGRLGSYVGRIGRGRQVPVPECRRPLTEAAKSQTELAVLSLTRAVGPVTSSARPDETASADRLTRAVVALTARVDELEAKLTIAQLMASYGPAVDGGLAEVAGALWSENGVYDSGVGVFHNPGGIGAMVAGEPHQSFINSGCAHIVSPPHIVVDGDRAVATCYSQLLFRDNENDGYRTWRVTANRWEWERGPDGWRVVSRVNRPLDGNVEARTLLGSAFDPGLPSGDPS